MQQIKYGSVCSGIEAATSAWHGFGWKASWFSEDVSDDISFTLTTGDRHGVYCGTQNDACRDVGLEISPTLRAGNGGGAVNPVANIGLVRRLTPIECERLQGFPDNHTQIPYRNKSAGLCPDGPRYAACGNSMAVPVMAWIGNRINEILKNESI